MVAAASTESPASQIPTTLLRPPPVQCKLVAMVSSLQRGVKCPCPRRASHPRAPRVRLGTAPSLSLPSLSDPPPESCWCCSWLCYQGRWDERELGPASLCRPGSAPGKKFWNLALRGGMEEMPPESGFASWLCLPQTALAGPWECLLKIRLDCVLTTLTHSVIFRKRRMALDRGVMFVNALHPGLAGSAAEGAQAAVGHSFPGAHWALAAPGEGCCLLSQPSITRCFTTSWRVTTKRLAPRRAAELLLGGGCPAALRPPRQGLGSSHSQDGELVAASTAGRRAQGGADAGLEFTRPARFLGEAMSKWHTLSSHGWRWVPAPIECQQGPTSQAACAHLPQLGPTPRAAPAAPAASLAVWRAPSYCQCRGLRLSCRHRDEVGEEKGRVRSKKQGWGAGEGLSHAAGAGSGRLLGCRSQAAQARAWCVRPWLSGAGGGLRLSGQEEGGRPKQGLCVRGWGVGGLLLQVARCFAGGGSGFGAGFFSPWFVVRCW